MTLNTTRFLFALPMLAVSVCSAIAFAQPAVQKPAKEPGPMRFAQGVRAVDALAGPTRYAAFAPGLFARPLLETSSVKGDYTVAVWALLVGPNTSTGEVKLPGAAVLSLSTGSVQVIVGKDKTRLEPGGTAAVPEGAVLRLVNADDSRPAHLRAVLVAAPR